MRERADRVVRHGNRELRFRAVMLGAATSQRAGVPRWSELTIYGLDNGGYLVAKVGRSRVAHKPECPRVTRRMPTWLDAGELGEARVHRMPCLDCQPEVGDEMDPHTRLEPQRYQALQAADADSLVEILREGRPVALLPDIVTEVLAQAAQSDPRVAAALT